MTDIDSRSIGDALDELNSKLQTLATAWGEELNTSGGIEFDKRELWLVRGGDGWFFAVVDRGVAGKIDVKTPLRSCSSNTRIAATDLLAKLRERLILVRGATQEEIKDGLKRVEELIGKSKGQE